jgi:hypothetical protein
MFMKYEDKAIYSGSTNLIHLHPQEELLPK